MSEAPKAGDHVALMDLFARVAHDLRGPAGITSGVLDELESRAGGNASADASLFAMARRGLSGVLRIAERLEMVAQLETGNLHVERLPLDWSELVRHAVDEAKIIQKRKAITVTCDVASGLGVSADRRWLSASIAEIVANAIRHAKTQVHVLAAITDGRARITVEDDGKGFSDDAIAAFDEPRFSRSSAARTGLGVSLSIARDIACAHGGGLRVVKGSSGGHVELEISEA